VKQLRALLAAHLNSADLLRIGAYQPGSDPLLDTALRVVPHINSLLQQGREDRAPLEASIAQLLALPTS